MVTPTLFSLYRSPELNLISHAPFAVQILLIFRSSIENWSEYQQANSIQGWTNDVPVCTWTGISCTDTGDIASL